MNITVFRFKKVKSTNNTAIRIAKKLNHKSGMIISETQSNGKGQYGKKWISYKGNLFVSFFHDLKDINLPTGTDLSTYSEGKLFLQTSVLDSSPYFSGNKKIQGIPFMYYEYEYNNKELVKMKTLVYHTLVLSTGYQMVITAPAKGFDQHKPLFNQIGNSLIIEH